jgi:SAM-dependent methyltransferase
MNNRHRQHQTGRQAQTPLREPSRNTPPSGRYLLEADVLDGLKPFAYQELIERFRNHIDIVSREQKETLGFLYEGDLKRLLSLRSIASLSGVLSFPVPRPKALLGHQHFEQIVDAMGQIAALHPPGAFQSLRLSAAGEESAVLTRLKQELELRTGMRIEVEEADMLLRLRRSHYEEGWDVLIRLSPRPLATRTWRVCNLPGAPNATLAHAVMRITNPHPHDRILNIGCGSGTLLIERLALGPAQSALGCDTDTSALACAQLNLAAARFSSAVSLQQWDARALPLPDASVDVICSDLPFGQLVGSHRENETLYPRLFAEATRVAAPYARMVLLTHELRLLERTAWEHRESWEHVETVRVRSGGMTPGIFLFRRRERSRTP